MVCFAELHPFEIQMYVGESERLHNDLFLSVLCWMHCSFCTQVDAWTHCDYEILSALATSCIVIAKLKLLLPTKEENAK
jgi:hypothetical protein